MFKAKQFSLIIYNDITLKAKPWPEPYVFPKFQGRMQVQKHH